MNSSKLKEEFMACKTFDEYVVRRDEFRQLGTDDKEVMDHLNYLIDAEGPFYAPKGAHMDVNFALWREANEDDV